MRLFSSVTKHIRFGRVLSLFCAVELHAQQWNDPLLHYPRFEACSEQNTSELPACFTQQINFLIFEAFI